jgi:hypothetical protein
MKIVLIISLLTSAIYSFGQLGSITGFVFDRGQGKGLSSANIVLDGTTIGCASDSKGNFRLDSVPFGQYRIRIGMVACDTTMMVNVNGHVKIEVTFPPPCKYDMTVNDNRCPKCHRRDKSIPINYGLLVLARGAKQREYYDGGCDITCCMPNWYCKRDKLKF